MDFFFSGAVVAAMKTSVSQSPHEFHRLLSWTEHMITTSRNFRSLVISWGEADGFPSGGIFTSYGIWTPSPNQAQLFREACLSFFHPESVMLPSLMMHVHRSDMQWTPCRKDYQREGPSHPPEPASYVPGRAQWQSDSGAVFFGSILEPKVCLIDAYPANELFPSLALLTLGAG